MPNSPRHESDMSPVPSKNLSASELADQFDELSTESFPPTKALKQQVASQQHQQHTYSSSPRQQFVDQSFLAFKAAGSTSTLQSSSPGLNSAGSSSSGGSSSLASSATSAKEVGEDFTLSSTRSGGRRPQQHNYNCNHHHPHGHQHQNIHCRVSSSKERYVFSNFRFLVKQNSHFPAVDEPLDWLSIEMVLVPEIESHVCPICLDLPRFPRFTRCGHIYCFPCVLQYFQSSEPSGVMGANWRTCPVCAEPVHLKQLRPVRFCPATEAKVGQILHTVLLEKPVGSLDPHPVDKLLLSEEAKTVSPFQRLIPVSAKFVLDEIWAAEARQARQDLKLLRAIQGDTIESTFLEAAMREIEERRKQLAIVESSPVAVTRKLPPPKDFYYFHQARDGLNVFLHPLCMKILFHHYGQYAAIPAQLSLPVLQCERVIIDSWSRKRLKYLDHLPLGTQIILAEVDLSACVSGESLAVFGRELAQRQHQRQEKVNFDAHSAATAKQTSILQEWQQMEDDYYLGVQSAGAIDIVRPPEIVKLDDLANDASFPLPSASSLQRGSSTAMPIMQARRPSIPSSHSFAAAAASPPTLSFSDLASSLSSPFFHHQSVSGNASSNVSSNVELNFSNSISNSPKSSASSPSTSAPASPGSSFADAVFGVESASGSGKKKIVLYSNNSRHQRR